MTTDKDKAFERVSLPIPCNNVGRFFFNAGWDAHAERVKTRGIKDGYIECPWCEAALDVPELRDANAHAERVKPLIEAVERARAAGRVQKETPPPSPRRFVDSMGDFGKAIDDAFAALDALTDREGEK